MTVRWTMCKSRVELCQHSGMITCLKIGMLRIDKLVRETNNVKLDMDLSRVIALSIFIAYFLLILTFFAIIVTSIRSSHGSKESKPLEITVYIFGLLAAVSFGHTWFCEYRIKLHECEI
jgi:hypothetical protein